MKKLCDICLQIFEVGKGTIHCLKCDRWYCSDTSCQIEYDDQNIPCDPGEEGQREDATYYVLPKGPNGEFVDEDCDCDLYCHQPGEWECHGFGCQVVVKSRYGFCYKCTLIPLCKCGRAIPKDKKKCCVCSDWRYQ